MAGRDYYSLKLKKILPVAMASGVECYWWVLFFVACLSATLFKGVLPAGACSIPDDLLSFYDLDNTGWLIADCVASHLAAFSLLVLSALALCALVLLRLFGCMSVSGLLNGVELVRAHDGGRVDFKAGLKFIFLRPGMMGFILLGFVFLASGGVIDLYIAIKIIFVSSFIGMAIFIYDFFSQQECTVIERISGTRFILSHKGQKYWDEKASRMRQGWRCFWHGFCFYCSALIRVTLFFVFGLIAFNLMREPLRFNTPEMLAIYDRPAPVLDDNLAVALAGLSAPEYIEDSYEYGREKSAFYINAVNKMKEVLRIRPHINIPDELFLEHSLEREGDEVSALNGIENGVLHCLYAMDATSDPERCPNGREGDVERIIEDNKLLWDRFQKIPNYKKYSSLAGLYSRHVFFDLSDLEAGYILSLYDQGERKKAISEWSRFMSVAALMASESDDVDIMLLGFALWGSNINALEAMLFDSPEMVVDWDDDFLSALQFDSVSDLNVDDIVKNYWAEESVSVYLLIGKSPALDERVLSCIENNHNFSRMSSLEFFSEPKRDLCPGPSFWNVNSVLTWSMSQPGFFISAIQQSLFLKLDPIYSVIRLSHNLISKTGLARAAIYILKNDIPEERIPDTLKTMKTERPILWDAEKKWLYVENPHEADEIPKLKFRLNLQRKVQ